MGANFLGFASLHNWHGRQHIPHCSGLHLWSWVLVPSGQHLQQKLKASKKGGQKEYRG